MSSVTVWFIRCALIYFVLAILLGIAMTLVGPQYPYMQIHVHFNLLGWMSMMVFGVGYHILPRFSGKPLWSEKLSYWQLYLANVGLIGMVAGWFLRDAVGPAALFIFSVVEAVSVAFFVINMLKTIKPVAAPAPAPAKK